MNNFRVVNFLFLLFSVPAWVYTYNIINFTNDIYYPKVVWGVEQTPRPVTTATRTLHRASGTVTEPATIIQFRSSLDKINLVASLLPTGTMVKVTHDSDLSALLVFEGGYFLSPTSFPEANKAILTNNAMTANDKTLELLKRSNRKLDYIGFSSILKTALVSSGVSSAKINIKGPVPPTNVTLAIVPNPEFQDYPTFDVIPTSELAQHWTKWAATMKPKLRGAVHGPGPYPTLVLHLAAYLPRVISALKLYGLPSAQLEEILPLFARLPKQ